MRRVVTMANGQRDYSELLRTQSKTREAEQSTMHLPDYKRILWQAVQAVSVTV